MKKEFRLIVTGGETGGHIYPLIAVVSEFQLLAAEKGIQPNVRYLGSPGQFTEMLKINDIKVKKVFPSKLRPYFSIWNIVDIPKFFISIVQALWKIYWFMPDVVFSKGGPGSLAVVLVARFYRTKIVIHESDSVPSRTSKVTSKLALVIAVAFPSTLDAFADRDGRVELVGGPIRKSLFVNPVSYKKAREHFELDSEIPLILILGGSSGATRINNFILDNLKDLLKITQIIHQTGWANYETVMGEFNVLKKEMDDEVAMRYKPVDFFKNDIHTALIASDIVVTRSGASAIFEIAAFGKPSILIPLPESTKNHQYHNAVEYAKTGAAIILEDQNLLPHLFQNQIKKLLTNPEQLIAMSEAAKKFYRPDASLKLAQILIKMESNE